jgi:glutaredoxin
MKAEVYSKPNCTYCTAAEELLKRRGIDYVKTDLTEGDNLSKLMERFDSSGLQRPQKVPQIFLDGEYVGGFDKLNALLAAK